MSETHSYLYSTTCHFPRPKKVEDMADKRINEFTQISSAPANGVLPIDVPGSEETNGITVSNLFKEIVNKKMFSLQSGEEIDTGINHAGLICVTAGNITGSAAIGISSINGTYVSVLSEGAGSIGFVDSPGKICCFKKDVNGTFFIRNNTEYSTPVSIAVL